MLTKSGRKMYKVANINTVNPSPHFLKKISTTPSIITLMPHKANIIETKALTLVSFVSKLTIKRVSVRVMYPRITFFLGKFILQLTTRRLIGES